MDPKSFYDDNLEKKKKRVIVYLRHGEDTKSGYKYDEKLTSRGKKDAKNLAKNLIQKYGFPDVIYCSPFYRTRQTRHQMSKVINRYTDKYIVNIIDPRLSRFFTKREMRNPDIRSDTMRKNAPIYETSSEFRNRVREQLYDMENKDEYNVIWCICHTLIIKYVAEFKNIQRDEHINYLDTVIIEI